MKRLLRNQKGSALIIVVIGMTVLMGAAALVTDIGLVFIEENKLKNTADAAALAGALDLPSSPDKAKETALSYIEKNGFPREIASSIVITDDNYGIQVVLKNRIDYVFARVLGFTDKEINVTSKALLGSVTAVYEGIRPFVVEKRQFSYGEQVVLKENGGDGYHGNYGATALGGTGARIYEENIINGYKSRLEVGDTIDTEPGNMAGPTLDGVDYIINGVEDIVSGDESTFNNYSLDSNRLWTIPVVDSLEYEGRSTVEVVGFALFFLEGAEKKAGKAEIIGRFIEFVTNGDISEGQNNYGLYGVKLVQ